MSKKKAMLDKLLREFQVPEREAAYWDNFPSRVGRQLRHQPVPAAVPQSAGGFTRWFQIRPAKWAVVLAVICVISGIGTGVWLERWRHLESGLSAQESARLLVYLRQISAVFPHQLRGIAFDQQGPRLLLSELPDVPDSAPIFLRICENNTCRSYITFSGQRIPLNGESCEVLIDAKENVLVIGRKTVWSSEQPAAGFGPYRVQAQIIGTS